MTFQKIQNPELNFWQKVAITANPDKCWIWRHGLQSSGYGCAFWSGRKRGAHVVAFLLGGGELKPNELVRHTVCRNKLCCNPRHL